MTRYRHALPQLGGDLFLTDGGIETTLIFHEGLELPDFAAFHLLKERAGTEALRKYFRTYAALAKRFGAGLILESATWRANADWAARLGYTTSELAAANRTAIAMLEELRDELERERTKAVISGCVGPRGDGYDPVHLMSERDAEAYHREQIDTFAGTAADMITAITMNYAEEAVGTHPRRPARRDAGGRLLHGRDRRRPGHRADAAGGDRAGRCRDIVVPRVLHDQLCSPDPLRGSTARAARMGQAHPGTAGERVDQEPCRAERIA